MTPVRNLLSLETVNGTYNLFWHLTLLRNCWDLEGFVH
jgi:hypothetical protein